ncbi:MAG: hypothetical protein PG978_001334 [Wolbachia endosymbiont of Ctenocephalides felis wCfeF]|nr:MAG: hypothetical protein PG978_001334 [Wolbachia endosymbiont of Ctenocephalides felis wCfeF]
METGKKKKMETEDKKSKKSLIRAAIDEELQKVIKSTDRNQRIEYLFNILILKICLVIFDEIDGGELEKLVRAFERLKSDISLSRSQEAIDDIVGEYREDFEGSGRC